MPRPRLPTNTFQISLRLDGIVQARTERIVRKLLEDQPSLRTLLATFPAALRMVLDRGLDSFEADLGLPAPEFVPTAPVPEGEPSAGTKPSKARAGAGAGKTAKTAKPRKPARS